MVKPRDEEQNFMNCEFTLTSFYFIFSSSSASCIYSSDGLWKEYPGPVLSSWDQVDEYLRRLTMQWESHSATWPQILFIFLQFYYHREIDELQAAVVSWYARFKADNKARLLRKLLSVFSPEALSTSSISSQLKEATVKREIGLDLPPEAVEGVGAESLTESDVSG